MNTAAPLSESAEHAARRYRMAILAFRGIYDAALLWQDALSPAAIGRLNEELYAVAASHVATEREILDRELADVVKIALRDARAHLSINTPTNPDDALSDAITASAAHVYHEIATQLERDIAQTVLYYRHLALKVEMHRAATGWSRQASFVAVRIADEAPKHWFKDRAGRRWPSQKFVRVVWRGALLRLYVETYLLTLARHGEQQAVIWHPDPSHEFFGLVIDIADGDTPYDSVRDAVFHPNSEALPRPVRLLEELAA